MPLGKLNAAGEPITADPKPLMGGAAQDDDTSWDGSTAAKVGGGALALGGIAALAHLNPGVIGKVAKTLNAVRMQAMLSGMALPKSILGNMGAAATASIERGSTKPLSEMFSLQTLKDAAAAFKRGPAATTTTGGATNLPKILSLPGRSMGAFDEAAQGALQRAGLTAKQATNEVLQTPLGENFGKMGTALENPAASYLLPFRRTPFNQAIEGAKLAQRAFEGDSAARRLLMVSMGGGAVHGAATADDNAPMSVPLAVAAGGRMGLPYAVGALMGRYYLGGANTNGNIPSNMLPVSEYGIDQSIKDPLRPFTHPAAITALQKMTGG